MNWLASRVSLRLRGMSEILDLGLVFCAENAKPYGRLALVVLLPGFAAAAALQAFGVSWWIVWPVAIALGVLADGAFTAAAGQLLFADSVRTRAVLGTFGRRMGSYVAARAVTAMVLALSAMVVLPLPLFAARTVFVPEYCLLETASPLQCFRRGARLMASRAAQGALMSALLVVARLAFIVACDALGQGLVEFVLQLGRPVGSLFTDGGSTYALFGYFLSIPYVSSARFLGYVDSRTRREGWDIQVRFAALLQRVTAEEAA